MAGGRPTRTLFAQTIGAVMDCAAAGGRRMRVYGEMVALLWDDGDMASALALEDLWNDIGEVRTFELLCAYPMSAFDDPAQRRGVQAICDQHTEVIPSEGYSLLSGEAERPRTVARLQQENTALHAEMVRLTPSTRCWPSWPTSTRCRGSATAGRSTCTSSASGR